jgi:hypothetical protein
MSVGRVTRAGDRAGHYHFVVHGQLSTFMGHDSHTIYRNSAIRFLFCDPLRRGMLVPRGTGGGEIMDLVECP